MTEKIVIKNPSDNVKKFFEAMKNRKEKKLSQLSEMESGIFSIELL